jgi:hypothetical protein
MPLAEQTRMMHALLREAGALSRTDRLRLLSALLDQPVTSTAQLDIYDVDCALDILTYWKVRNRLRQRTWQLLGAPRM